MNLRQKKKLLNIFLAVVCAAVLGACLVADNQIVCIAALGLCVVYGVVHSSIWRCPKCGGSLGRGKPKHCPHCGKEIEYG